MVKNHFSREAVLWMSITELNDYINIINAENEKEKKELQTETSNKKESPNDFYSKFGGKNPLRK